MTRWRLLIGAAAVLGALVVVPAVLAAQRPDDRADRGVGVVTAGADAFRPVGTADTVEARIRAGLDGRGSVLLVVRPDDRAGQLGVGGVTAGTPTVAPTGSTSTDPAVDPTLVLGVGLVIAALAVTAFVLVDHGRRGGGSRGSPGAPAASH